MGKKREKNYLWMKRCKRKWGLSGRKKTNPSGGEDQKEALFRRGARAVGGMVKDQSDRIYNTRQKSRKKRQPCRGL